jgi:hypothetical protein
VKRTKKAAPSPAVALAMARVSARHRGSKDVAGGTKKTAALPQKCDVPASHMSTEASSVESHESSPHDPLPRDPLPEAVSRPECEALLQITPAAGVSGASILGVVAAIAIG